jgi:MoxR-like ATPase
MILSQTGLKGRDGFDFLAERALIDTANAAWILGAPLLLAGEPGCGKTDFAFAVARWYASQTRKAAPPEWDSDDPEHGLLQCYVRSGMSARDLLYTHDAVRRFSDAQAAAVDPEAHRRAADVRFYIDLAPLGRALDAPGRRIVLIDEIDKAPSDLPNDLLRELDQGHFTIHEIGPRQEPVLDRPDDPDGHLRLQRQMGHAGRPAEERPFIIVTSNAERQLPDAFLRRCVFYHLRPPSTDRLKAILSGRFPDLAGNEPDLLDAAVATYSRLRTTRPALLKVPATSELIAWTDVLQHGPGITDIDRHLVRSGAWTSDRPRAWSELPALGTLIKLSDDLRTLGVDLRAST